MSLEVDEDTQKKLEMSLDDIISSRPISDQDGTTGETHKGKKLRSGNQFSLGVFVARNS